MHVRSEIMDKGVASSPADLAAIVDPLALSPIAVTARLRDHQMKQGVAVGGSSVGTPTLSTFS